MYRTSRVSSDALGSRKTQVWEANEIGFANVSIAVLASAESRVIYVEGYQHFHIYVTRVNASSGPTDISVIGYSPLKSAGLVRVFEVVLATWVGGGTHPNEGVFYFGVELGLTDPAGKTFRFSPLVGIKLTNNEDVQDTYNVALHCQD